MTQLNMDDMEISKGSFAAVMSNIEERMANFEAELQKSLKSTTSAPTLVSLATDFTYFKQFVLNTLQGFKHQVEILAREVDTMEMRSRRKMLLVHGVAEQKGEDTAQLVVAMCKQQLNLQDLTADDVRRSNRMGRAAAAQKKPRPILVKFVNMSVRDRIWYTKSKLKGTGVTLSEFLTKERHNVFTAARERFGVAKCWTREGRIFVLDPDGVQHRISSVADLNRLNLDRTKTPAAPKTAVSKPRRGATVKK